MYTIYKKDEEVIIYTSIGFISESGVNSIRARLFLFHVCLA